jgi:hypothetical protein
LLDWLLMMFFTSWNFSLQNVFSNCERSFHNLYIWLVIHDSSYCFDFPYNFLYLYISLFCCKSSTYHSFCLLLMIHLVLKFYYNFFLQQIFDFFVQSIFCLLTHSNNFPFHDFWHNPYCCSLALLVHALLRINILIYFIHDYCCLYHLFLFFLLIFLLDNWFSCY